MLPVSFCEDRSDGNDDPQLDFIVDQSASLRLVTLASTTTLSSVVRNLTTTVTTPLATFTKKAIEILATTLVQVAVPSANPNATQ
jgi:hypothetical protein